MLTERRQQQAIANLIHNLEPGLSYTQLSKPYQAIWQEVKACLEYGCDPYEIHQALYRFKWSSPY